MGCGGSSLKGDVPEEVGAAPKIVRKGGAEFKDVDYNTTIDPRKRSMPGDRAPDEIEPPKPKKEETSDDVMAMAPKNEDISLEPYKSITDPSAELESTGLAKAVGQDWKGDQKASLIDALTNLITKACTIIQTVFVA